MNVQKLTDTARTLFADDKGLLAMDESTPTSNKQFAALGIPQTEAARTLLVVITVLVLPYLPLGRLFGLVPLTPQFLVALVVLMLFYVAATEIAKWFFYRKMGQKK